MTSTEPGIEALRETSGKPGRICNLDASGVSLTGVNLDGLCGDEIRFSHADLAGATLRRARLTECRFDRSNLSDADFSQATLRSCSLDGAVAIAANCDAACIEDCSAQAADFSRTVLRGARLSETSWNRASLRSAVLDDSRGEGVDFRGADLRGASLRRARIREADFRGADLTGADLTEGDFSHGDFRGAILDDVVWSNVNAAGARWDDVAVAATLVESSHRPGANHAEASSTPAAGDANKLAACISELFAKAISTSAAGTLDVQRELGRLGREWAAFQSRAGQSDIDGLATLLDAVRNCGGTNAIAPMDDGPSACGSSLDVLARLLQAMQSGDELEPPREWKDWLQTLFPELKGANDGSIDALASRMSAILQGPR